MKDIIYRLGEYKIVESGTGVLRWEAHYGVGMLREGACYKKGEILFIGPVENLQEGFLKLEFIENLKTTQAWSKTRFFCTDHNIYRCVNGKKVTRDEMHQWMFEKDDVKKTDNISQNLNNSYIDDESEVDSSFRLFQYKITKRQNSQIVWDMCAGNNIIRTGACTLLEDILFIGPVQSDRTRISKQQYHANLRQLPKWDQTKYYCIKHSLQECKRVNQVSGKKRFWLIKNIVDAGNKEVDSNNKSSRLKPSMGIREGFVSKEPENNSTTRIPFKINMFLTAILFFLILLSVFLIGYWREHSERSHYKKVEYSHRNYKRH